MKEEKNEAELFDKLSNNYLDEEQMDYLIDVYSDKALSFCQSFCENEIQLSDNFIKDLSVWWATEDLMHTEIYQYYVRQMLIKPDFAYLMRDYFIICISKN